MVGIYKITSPSGAVYIGQSWDIKERLKDYTKGRCPYQTRIHHSICKYGHKNHVFKVIHELPADIDQETLNRFEQFYMDAYRDCGIELMNLREAGSAGKLSDETKRKLSEANKGKASPNKGRTGWFKHTEEWKLKNSLRAMGNKSKTGQKNSPEAIKKTADANRGKPRSDEVKRRISIANKKGPLSEERKAKLRGIKKGQGARRKKLGLPYGTVTL